MRSKNGAALSFFFLALVSLKRHNTLSTLIIVAHNGLAVIARIDLETLLPFILTPSSITHAPVLRVHHRN